MIIIITMIVIIIMIIIIMIILDLTSIGIDHVNTAARWVLL